MNIPLIYEGKVRSVYGLGEEFLLLKASDRVSSFDRHIGIISGKGMLLNRMSEFWFKETEHIIPNHLITTQNEISLVHRCLPFKIEVVIRGYITGNTDTSLWTHYNKGERVYCGITFPDNLKKNQKLESPVITPTTKGKIDRPISKKEIIDEGYMTEDECNYIFTKAMELFTFGQEVADKAGFILVDTKYEFGKNLKGEILLIDEVHTCDSSRYWLKETYNGRFSKCLEPEKLDKDCVRDWVRSVCDPYKDIIPAIPFEIITKAYNSYKYFYDTISSVTTRENIQKCVIILSGSIKDTAHVSKIKNELQEKKIGWKSFIASAHRNTQEVLNIINKYDTYYTNLIWVTVAGKSNALSGVVAANSTRPVIACPPFTNTMDMMVNLSSTLQCPSGVPVMTILNPINVAIAVEKIFNLNG